MSKLLNTTDIVTPTRTKSLRKLSSSSSSSSTLKPILKTPPASNDSRPINITTTAPSLTTKEGAAAAPIMRDMGTWTPSRKKSVNSAVLPTTPASATTISINNDSSNNNKLIHNTELPSFDPIAKKTILPTQLINKEDLPWEQYASPIPANYCQQSVGDYEDMINELNVSHALVVASHFKTMSFVEADKLLKKFQHLKLLLDSLYGRIRIHNDTTKATVMTLKLDSPQKTEYCQLNECTNQFEQLVEEFYFTSKYANHLESTYLQHLAGTLFTTHNTKKEAYYYDDTIFISILNRLRSIFENHNDEESLSSLSSSPSSSSSSSLSSISSKPFSSSKSSSVTTLDPPTIIHQQIDAIIEKLSRQLKQKEELIRLFEIQTKNLDTQDELAKQRERSAGLVLELERSRSQRLLLAEKKRAEEVAMLKDQVMQETLRRQSLQDRVTALEHTLKTKDKIIDSSNSKLEALKNRLQHEELQIRKLQDELNIKNDTSQKDLGEQAVLLKQLESEKADWESTKNEIITQCSTVVPIGNNVEEVVQQLVQQCKQDQLIINQQQEEITHFQNIMSKKEELRQFCDSQQQSLIEQLQSEKAVWLNTKKSILNQYSSFIDTNDQKQDLELLIPQIVDNFGKQELKSLQRELQQRKESSEQKNQAKLETNLLNDTSKLTQLQQEFDEAIKTFTTRESAYILQSASTEAELERILKEYDRLTRNIIDFNSERKKFELEIQNLNLEKIQISKQLADEQIRHINTTNDSVLRKEFRDLMASVKEKHAADLVKELEARRQVEQQLRDKKSEIEMKLWEKVDIAVQTNFQLPYL